MNIPLIYLRASAGKRSKEMYKPLRNADIYSKELREVKMLQSHVSSISIKLTL